MNQNNSKTNEINIDMSQEISVQNTVNKKRDNKTIITVIICVVIFIYFIFKSSLLGYHSIDFKNDEQVKAYLTKYINEKYNTDCNLILKNKALVQFCTAWIDGCIHYAKNNSIYNYRYTGTDENNNKFQVNYTNDYIGKGIHKSKIDENYHIYDDVQKIERVVNNHYDVSDVYFQLASDDNYSNINDNEIVIRIYDENNNIHNLSNVNDDILSITKKFKIIYTTDYETYEQMLNDNSDLLKKSYSWQEPNFLTKDLRYSRIKDNFNEKSEYKQALSLIKQGNDNYTIILMNLADTEYYIYQQKNN